MSTTSMKPSALAQKRFLLPLLTSPVVTFALTLLLLQPVQAQQSQRRVSLPNQDYTESTQDLAVKTAGGRVVINRTWSWGRWYLNDAWADLSLRSAPYMRASPGQTAPIIAIGRAERIYKRVTAATLAAAEAGKASTARQDCHAALAAGAVKAGDIWRLNENNAIRALGQAEHITGWQWYDQAGNTIDYDAQGRMQSWSSPAGVKTSLIRDEAGRILGVKDHAGRQVISIDYGGGLLPVRVQDTEGHSVSYEWQPLPAPIQASGNAAAALAHARLLKASDARGGVWHYEYNAGGHISRRTDPEGGQIKLEYYPVSVDTITRPASGSGSAGGGGGGSSSAIAPMPGPCDHASALNRPSLIARVHSLTDEAGRKTEYEVGYEHIRREYRIAVSLPGGAQQRLRFDHTGRLIENTLAGMQLMHVQRLDKNSEAITDARGQTTRIWYDSALTRRPVKIIWPDGSSESNEYDAAGRRIRHTSPLGVVSAWSYGERGQALIHTEAVGLPEERTWRWRYDSLGQRTQSTLGAKDGRGPDALTEHYAYDSWGNLTEMRDAAGHSSRASYNSQGLPLTHTDPEGRTTRYAWDAAGNLTSITNAQGEATRYQYDARGRRTAVIRASGQTSRTRYSAAGQVIEQLAPGQNQGQGLRIEYSDAGLPTKTTGAGGLVATTAYDEIGRRTKTTDPAGNVTTYEYGAEGSPLAGLLTHINYPTYRESRQYDPMERQTAVTQHIEHGKTQTQHQAWDAAGNRISTTDAQGRTTLYEYDALARLIKTTDALGGVTRQSWDAHGRLLSVTDALGHRHTYEYDKAGRLIKETRPLGGANTYAYDKAGWLTQRVDAGGNTHHYAYDAAGRITREEHKKADQTLDERTSYQYDPDGQLTAYEQSDAQGRLISSARYRRDEQGRIQRSETTYGSANPAEASLSYQTGQSFNADGQLQSHQYPDGSAQRYSYQNGQLTAITLPNQSQIHYGSYRWMQPQQIRTPGATKTLSYDALQRPTLIEIRSGQNPNKLLAQRRYAYDEAGNIVQIQSELGQTGYDYDPLNRLSKAEPDQALQTLGLPQEAYSYDAAGNRLSSAHQAGAWAYNADNQMTQYPATTPFERNPGVETQVSYTAQGHTQKESNVLESKEYEYNAAERLIRYASTEQGQSGPQIEASYRHDPFGRRIAKTVKQGGQTKTTYYIYSEQGLMAEADEKGQMTKAYGFNPLAAQQGLWSTDPVWQAETPSGSLTDPKARYDWLHTDHLGTPILATTKEGQVSWKAIAESFGSTQIIEQDIEVNLRFPGQYYDQETQTHYNFHRDYRPNAGRYLQEDPIGLEGGINLFAYVNNNPLLLIDSFGLKGKAKAKADPCPTCDAQLPESPVKEVALTCFAEASYDCDEGDKEKRAITDVIYNRVKVNKSYWGGNTVMGVVSMKKQFLGYRSPQYKKAENNTDKLEAKECQKLKDCIDAALASSEGVQYEYNAFNQQNKEGKTKICVHYFEVEKQGKK